MIRTGLRQIGQIHFQGSARTGLALLAALAAVNAWAALAMALGSAVALLTARLARLPPSAEGLHGYNAALTGAGLLTFFAPSASVFAFLAVASAGTTLLTAGVAGRRLPALTLPFVAAMGIALALDVGVRVPPPDCAPDWTAIVCGAGQVTFVAEVIPAAAIVAALAWHDRAQAAWLLAGAAFGWTVARLLEAPAVGLMVNAALVGQGLTAFGRPVRLRLAAIAATAPVGLALASTGLPTFTLAFNLVTWGALLLRARAPVAAGTT